MISSWILAVMIAIGISAGIGAVEELPREQVREESLGEVLGVVRRFAAPPDVTINRQPVGAAEKFQGLAAVILAGLRREHDAPAGGGENLFPGGRLKVFVDHGEERAGAA